MVRHSELDPLSLAVETDLGTCYYWSGDYQEAIEHLTRVVMLEDNFYVAHIFLGLTFARLDRLAEAIAELKKAGAQSNNPVAAGILGFICGAAGMRLEAQEHGSEYGTLTRDPYLKR